MDAIDSIADWASIELSPALKMLGGITMQAIDSLPFPLLVVAFLALLALARWPDGHRSPSLTLPYYSPQLLALTEKSRLSPLPTTPPSSFPFSSPRSSVSFAGPVFYPTLDGSGRPQYVAVVSDSSKPGTRSPPRSTGAERRSSKNRLWNRSSSSLAAVDEALEEVAEV